MLAHMLHHSLATYHKSTLTQLGIHVQLFDIIIIPVLVNFPLVFYVLNLNYFFLLKALTCTIFFWFVLFVRELDLIWKLVVQLNLCFLCQGILGNCLKSLFNIDGLLSTGFKVWNVTLTMAPALAAFCGYLHEYNNIEIVNTKNV